MSLPPGQRLRLAALAVVAFAMGCHDEATNPDPYSRQAFRTDGAEEIGPGGRLPSKPALRGPILPLYIGTDFGPELTDEQLVDEVAALGGRVIIGLKPASAGRTRETGMVPGMTESEVYSRRAELEALGVEITMTYRRMSFVAARLPAELAPVIRRLPFVNYVNPDRPLHLSSQDTSWGVHKVRVPAVWDSLGYTAQAAAITMIDSGVDSIHIHNSNLDGPQNFDVFDGCLYASPPFTSCWDDTGHGTHISGILSGRDNDTAWVGIAYYPSVFSSVKSCGVWEDEQGVHNACVLPAIVAGIDWALEAGYSRHIVNMSISGCEGSEDLAEAVQTAANGGLLLVASAGNTNECTGLANNNVLWPAKYSSVMAVSGTLENDTLAPSSYSCSGGGTGGSRYGNEIEISAPFTAWSVGRQGDLSEFDCGTSQSTAVVSAVAALLWTQNQSWSAASIRSHLKNTAVPLGGSVPNQQYGYGRVDALNALGVRITTSGPSQIWSAGNYTWTATPSGGTGSYVYLWEYSTNGTSYTSVGTSASYQRYVGGSDPTEFYLRVTVTGGNQVKKVLWIQNFAGNPCWPEIIC